MKYGKAEKAFIPAPSVETLDPGWAEQLGRGLGDQDRRLGIRTAMASVPREPKAPRRSKVESDGA